MKWMNFAISLLLMTLFSRQSFAQPTITSFTPQSGPIGTSVTITGTGFGTGVLNNIVFFGAVKAQITAASPTSITVNVPIGATYRPLTVNTGGLTAYSISPFDITFPSGPTFNSTSFAGKVDFASGNYPRNVSIGDIDGDGKPDLASVNNDGDNVSIFRNISTPGTVALAAPLFIATGTSPFGEKLVDIDGDGKLDLIVNNYAAQTFSLFRNTSTPGNISFAAAYTLTANQNNYWIDLADFDGDGKPDLISFNQNSDTYTVFKNASTPGNISFPQRTEAILGFRPSGGAAADLDGDGKPDFAVAGIDDNTVSIFRNTSSGSTISFAPKVTYVTGTEPFNVTIGDIDGDGKKELLVPNALSTSISIFKNNSTPGNISFAPKTDFGTGASTQPLYISVDDLDGDGKIDIAVANFNSNTVSVFKNQSTPGNIALDTYVQYATGSFCRSVPLGDIDGDGRPDIVSSNSLSFDISVLRNTTYPLPCSGAISLFPYREVFEINNGGWTTGGTASDWTWGAPSKPVISAAGEGNKCWVTGGLSNLSYSNNENSFLQSPCFNFASLAHPRISFKLFWETETMNDGATMQYSINGGTSWNTVGSISSNSNCQGVNWYNSSGITALNSSPGWSGNKQPPGICPSGNGSSSWLTASHDLTSLAGQTNVSFRFIFGSGSGCNAFDGFAIDDVNIFESLPAVANFNYACNPNRLVDFTNLSACSASSWNFGDPASGTGNMSSVTNPTHVFSAAGTFTVTLTSTFPTGTSTNSKQVNILDVSAMIVNPITCAGTNTATLSASATGSSSPYNFVWNTTPPQTTPTVTNIGAGNYTVTVTSGTACPVTVSLIVTEPGVLKSAPVVTPQKCNTANGAIVSNVSGGTQPYNYSWNTSASTANITGLVAGSYSLLVIDSKGCSVNTNNIIVPDIQEPIMISLGPDTVICPGQQLILGAGNYLSYLWQDNSVFSTYTVTQTGRYTLTVGDVNGCIGRAGINVTVDCSDIYFPDAFTPNGDTRNELFGPAGNNFSSIKNYSFNIYNRYGELAFHSTNPYNKWDGRFKGRITGLESFVWYASYTMKGKQQVKKGVVTVIR